MDSVVRKRYDWEQLTVDLYEGLVANPDGLTIYEIRDLLDVPLRVARKTVTKLRLDLGEGDSITVPYKNNSKQRLYFLSGTLDESQDWLTTRARFKASCIRTDVASLRSLIAQADGRTKDGRVLKRLFTSVVRLDEDLSEYLSDIEVSA